MCGVCGVWFRPAGTIGPMTTREIGLSEIVRRGALDEAQAERFRATFPCPCCETGRHSEAVPFSELEVEAVMNRIVSAFPELDEDDHLGVDISS